VSDEPKKRDLDPDIIKSRADILRAKSLIPPFGKPPQAQPRVPDAAPVAPDLPRIEETTPEPVISAQPEIAQVPPAIENEEIAVSAPIEPAPEEKAAVEELGAQVEAAIESTPAESSEIALEHVSPVNGEIIENEDETSDENSEIPRFNLAEQIMAEQRKFVASRRRGPGAKPAEPQAAPEQPEPIVAEVPAPPKRRIEAIAPPYSDIIARIVARDIQRLRVGQSVF
jgi:hypothetical protein